MIDQHTHKIGVQGKNRRYTFKCECGKQFQYDEAQVYVERLMGPELGRKYWIKLRTMLDLYRFQSKKGNIMEGLIYPENFKENYNGISPFS